MTAGISPLAALLALARPDKGGGVSIPPPRGRLQPGDNVLRRGGILPIQSAALENTLDGLGHVQPTTARGSIEWHNAMLEQPLNPLKRFMTGQIIHNQQHP